ncbi:annexin D3-like isoform X4 [Rhododendron vialii]|uniref:annexin D3-like isoform X4 n=1 Tax=Rhododendron vialii TaxID=182163 RepID=UPI00265E56A5|nr:annexin D3-like isoform X4 [Rhododendron vialii]
MASLRVPDDVPLPSEDCNTLHKAFKGWGTDEKAIIRVLGCRNSFQRGKIREAYQQIYNESLIDQLHSELSGDFRKAVILWTYDPPERDARLANKALKSRKKGITQLQVIVEIACATSPHHLVAVRQAYRSLFDCSLEEDITFHVPLPVRKDIKSCGKGLLVSVLRVVIWCIDAPEKHFAEVIRASVVGLGTDEVSLTRAIVSRAEIDMMKIRGEYFNVNKTSMDNAVKEDTSGDYRNFLMALLGAKI